MSKMIIILVLLAAPITYYFAFHPPVVLKRGAEKSLDSFSQAVESKDRAKIGAALQTLLTDDAKIRLEISFFSITQQNAPAQIQDFTKAQFIAFIDNTLYPLTDYAYYATLKDFTLAGDKQSAQVIFTSKQWGDGNNYYGGTAVAMRFSADAICQGGVHFINDQAQLNNVVCKLQFRSVPKPSELGKIQGNADAMREYLSK